MPSQQHHQSLLMATTKLLAVVLTVFYCSLPLGNACPHVLNTPFIYVRNDSINNTPACWFGGEQNPCGTLSYALEGVHNTSNATYHPGVFLYSGSYELSNGNHFSTFDGTQNPNLCDVAIVGQNAQNRTVNDPPSVVVYCQTSAGLTFFNIVDVTVKHIRFVGCGAVHYSTSKENFTHENTSTVAKFKVALFLVLCENVVFQQVWVDKSPGTGVVVYATIGYNCFEHCWFRENRYNPSDPKYSGGGGLYLEFPYCLPTIDGLCNSRIPSEVVSNSFYLIQDCHMKCNEADLTNRVDDTFILPNEYQHVAFGRGGGLSVFFKGNAHNNTVIVNQSSFAHNKALWGGGMFAEFQDDSSSNSFHVYNSVLEHNYCPYNTTLNEGTGGGGTRFGYLFFGNYHVNTNSILFDNCTFKNNSAYYGGGVSFYAAREPGISYATNTLSFSRCRWHGNKARVGAAVDLSVWHAVSNGSTVRVVLRDIIVAHHTIGSNLQQPGTVVGLGAMYIDTMPVHFDGYIHFHDNYHTALAAIDSQMDFVGTCVANFTNNQGRNGAAMALFGSSFIRAHNGTQMSFTNNSAQFKGGAIFSQSAGQHDLLSSRNCFIRYEDITVTQDKWNAYFSFSENKANGEDNSIYATTVLPCLLGGAFGPNIQNSTEKVFCWSSKWQYSNRRCPPHGVELHTSEIETDPGICNCANCSMSMIPGERKKLPLFMTDDFGNLASDRTVFVAYSHDKKISLISNSSRYIVDGSIKLNGKPETTVRVDLYTQDPRIIYQTVHVKLKPCPPGFLPSPNDQPNKIRCTCDEHSSFNGLIRCTKDNHTARLDFLGVWIGECEACDPHNSVVAGQTLYTFNLTDEQMTLPHERGKLSQQLCRPSHRKGTLCGKCMSGYGPAINSHIFKCIPCPHGKQTYSWILFLLTEMLPQTVLFAILVLFNISLTSGPANAFILFAQAISSSFALYVTLVPSYRHARDVYIFFYDIWNLNFFDPVIPHYCLSPTITTANVIALDYLVAFYPLVLIGLFFLGHQLFNHGRIIYCLCLPLVLAYRRLCQRYELRPGSSIHALTAFLLLSYTKFTTVSIRLLSPSFLYNASGHVAGRVMYFDGSIQLFKQTHLQYVVPAIFVLIVFVSLPPLVLIIYPIKGIRGLVKQLTRNVFKGTERSGRIATEFKHLLNSFYGCYKDGSGGTYDLRWFAGLYFVFRIVSSVLCALNNIPWPLLYTLQQMLCIAFVFIVAITRPYRRELYNYVDVTIFTILAAINALSHYNFHLADENKTSFVVFAIEYVLIWIPLLYMLGYLVLYGFVHYWKRKNRGRVESTAAEMQVKDDHISDDSIIKLVDSRDGAENSCDGYLNRSTDSHHDRRSLLSGQPTRFNWTLDYTRPTRSTAGSYGIINYSDTSNNPTTAEVTP